MTEADKGGTTGAANPASDIDRAKQRLEDERRAASDLAREAQGTVGGLGARAKQAAVRQGEEVREEAVSHLRNFADAVRHAGDELGEKEPGVISDVVREAAYGLERFTDSLARKQPSEIFGAMRDFGRRHPGAFVVGSMLIGFAAARFATGSSSRRSYERPDYRSGYGSAESQSSYEGAYAAGARARPAGAAPGGYPGAGVGAGVGGTGTGYGSSGVSGSGTGGGTGTGYGSSGVSGSGTSGGTGAGSSASADVAKTGAAHPNSPGTSGVPYGSSGTGSSGAGSTGASSGSGPGSGSTSSTSSSDTAGVSMGGPGQGVTGVPTGSDVPRKPSATDNKTGGR